MTFTKIQTYDLIEESITNGQLICEVETDVNSVSYSITSSTNQYFSVLENKVFLTGDGKVAINKDYPSDITKEIQFLNFTIIAVDQETGAKITQDVTVKVQRVIDNPPYVLNHFEHEMYVDNLYPGMLVAKLDLVYNTFANIVGTDSSFFDIMPIPTIGTDNITIKLNNNGVDKFANLDFSTLNTSVVSLVGEKKVYSYKLVINLVDATNNKSDSVTIYAKFVEGDHYKNLPIKNNAEIQAELLATKISDIVVKQEGAINSQSFYISSLKRKISTAGSQVNLNRTQINKLNSLIIENISENKEVFKFTNDKIKVIVESNVDMYDVIYKTVANYLNTCTNSDLENKADIFYRSNMAKAFGDSERISSKSFSDYLMSRTDTAIDKRFENIETTIDAKFLKFYNAIYSNIITPSNSKNAAIVSGINSAVSKIKTATIMANKAFAVATNADNNAATVSNRLSSVEVRKLENLGTSDGWSFSGDSINYDSNTVVEYSSNTTVYGSENVCLHGGNGDNLKWDGSDLTFSNTDATVTAKYFIGTASKAEYADLAEFYKKEINDDYIYEPGTIVYLNRSTPEKDFEVTENHSGNIYCGVITTNPGFILNNAQENENHVCIALNGRVPVKCIGIIKKGMYLYPSLINPNIAEGTYNIKNDLELIGISLENSSDINIKLILSKVK